jgi:prepilin-type processing-associated H-X9-DG protein
MNAGEAIMADDNEGGWTHGDGTVNLLLGDGNVRTLSYPALRQRYGVGPFEADKPIATCGPDSPIPECRKLAY